jgi:hypothetical protein
MIWPVKTTNEFDAWFAGLDDDAKVEIIAVVELLKLLGPQLSRPHADTLNGSKYVNMKELRRKRLTRFCGSPSHLPPNETPYCFSAAISPASARSVSTGS